MPAYTDSSRSDISEAPVSIFIFAGAIGKPACASWRSLLLWSWCSDWRSAFSIPMPTRMDGLRLRESFRRGFTLSFSSPFPKNFSSARGCRISWNVASDAARRWPSRPSYSGSRISTSVRRILTGAMSCSQPSPVFSTAVHGASGGEFRHRQSLTPASTLSGRSGSSAGRGSATSGYANIPVTIEVKKKKWRRMALELKGSRQR